MRIASCLLTLLLLGHATSQAEMGDVVRDLTIEVVDTEGKSIPGALVYLCLLDAPEPEKACTHHISSKSGEVELSIEPIGRYEIRVRLEGFLPITLGPLKLGERERDWVDYPDRLVAMLNVEIVV